MQKSEPFTRPNRYREVCKRLPTPFRPEQVELSKALIDALTLCQGELWCAKKHNGGHTRAACCILPAERDSAPTTVMVRPSENHLSDGLLKLLKIHKITLVTFFP
ncbi:hypothetical protein [Neisseria dumasiana]|uniref:hypothetical protein n=1 Tax=Neisseria dumasiana TaxID=1931275 RepID=UPI00117E065B|nr:hypothetical protein [Neisseria dumasiana]